MMKLCLGCNASLQSVHTCLLVLLTLVGSVVTSQPQQTFLSKINNKRLDVTAQNVTTHSATECYVTCQQTSGCLSVNLSPDRRTCQLLSRDVSDEASLRTAEGWSYLRECLCFCLCCVLETMSSFPLKFSQQLT